MHGTGNYYGQFYSVVSVYVTNRLAMLLFLAAILVVLAMVHQFDTISNWIVRGACVIIFLIAWVYIVATASFVGDAGFQDHSGFVV